MGHSPGPGENPPALLEGDLFLWGKTEDHNDTHRSFIPGPGPLPEVVGNRYLCSHPFPHSHVLTPQPHHHLPPEVALWGILIENFTGISNPIHRQL